MQRSRTSGVLASICGLVLLFSLNGYAAHSADKDFSLNIKNACISAQLKSIEVTKINEYDRIKVPGLNNFAAPGEPLLPIKTVKYLIPYGKKVSNVSVGWTRKKYLYGTYFVEPAQAQVPTSYTGNPKHTLPKPDVYARNTAYPETIFKIVSTQQMRGYKILIINLYPVEYIPAAGKLAYYENLNLNITLANASTALGSNPLYRGIAADQKAVSDFIDNPDDLNTYPTQTAALQAPLAAVDYLIITSPAFEAYAGVNNLNDLLTHKQSKGLTTAILDTDFIYANYSGADNAEQIRTCIRAYYTASQTQYVLLVGDADAGLVGGETETAPIIPSRGLYGYVLASPMPTMDPDNNIPCDMYYGCSGDFDFNANGIYGERTDGDGGGDVNLLADVYIGRAPVDSTAELANFVKKTIAYENSTASYLTSACMAGEDLSDGDYGKPSLEEIRNGSSANGYTTRGMAETGYFSYSTLYDQDSLWETNDLVAILNSGAHILNHIGHANNTTFAKEMFNVTVDALTNTDYFFGYTQGCYSGAFDNRLDDGTYDTADCILEHFTTQANGAFAFIGNSRYGWYSPASTDGASQRIHREFWDAVVYEGITNLGAALQDAKNETIGLVGVDDAQRWAYFSTNLLGDPQTPLNAAFLSPTGFTANNIAFANSSWITLSWRNSVRYNLSQVMIRYRTDGVYPTSETDGTLLLSKTAVPGSTETYNHTNVIAGTTYNYVAFGYDGTNYEGSTATTNRATATALLSSASADSGSSSSCFVATVCYGNQHAPEVVLLRKFRDKQLMRDFQGRQFVALYYIFGPKLAALIKDNDAAKQIGRCFLKPLVNLAEFSNKGDQ
ncbi:MAG: C25 family cysteine peptidase [Candidatus Omnitrophota bacterium]